jgi:hypothetical protein
MTRCTCGRRTCTLLLAAHLTACAALAEAPEAATDRVTDFAEGRWNQAQWTPLRLPHQPEMKTFEQKTDCLGTNAFSTEDKKTRRDNVLLMTDTGTDEGEFEITFVIGPEKGSAPGIFLCPTVNDGILESAFSVFVASYTMAVWRATTDADKGETDYEHLVRMNRWSEPGKPHVLRCRYSRKRKSIALRLDDSDVLMFRDVGLEINSRIGIWGCHGTCDFYQLRMIDNPELPWSATPPAEPGD